MRSITVLSAALLFTGVAQAQVQDEIRRCAAINVDAERLACYDRLFRQSPVAAAAQPGAAAAAPASGASSGAAAAAPNAPAASNAPAAPSAPAVAAGGAAGAASAGTAAGAASAEFGTNPRLAEEQKRRESQGKSEELQELRARIRKVDQHPYGLHVLTLENGQVWQQKEKVWELDLKPGDEVVIRRGMLGSYRMQLAGQGVSSLVTRVK